MVIGTRDGHIMKYDCKNIEQMDPKLDKKILDKKEIKLIQAVKRMNDVDVYFSTEDSFFWLESMSEKRRIIQNEA